MLICQLFLWEVSCISQFTLKPTLTWSCAPPRADWLCFLGLHKTDLRNLLSLPFSRDSSSGFGIFSSFFFPISPSPSLRGHAPTPSSSSSPLSSVFPASLFALRIYPHNKYFTEAILYSCTEQHCLFLPSIKAIWFVSQGHFLQSEINVWILEQGCFLFGLDPIKSCLAP